MSGPNRLNTLRADCSRCFALCCVVPAFAASADFAISKPAGRSCPNLAADHGCTIHGSLNERGFAGCVVYDCFGAGQHVSQVIFGGRDPMTDELTARRVAQVYPIVRGLHELLWYLDQARTLPVAAPLGPELAAISARVEDLAAGPVEQVVAVHPYAVQQDVDRLLRQISRWHRAAAPQPGASARRVRKGADLIGADLRRADLRAADLRGVRFIGADLRGADLRGSDLIGADLRAADLCGADLRDTVFLTQPQVNAARGDASTSLPPVLRRPIHWVI